MDTPHQIHNNFFLKTFSDTNNVIDLLKIALPPALLQEIDLSTLDMDMTSYVSDRLRGAFSDLVVKLEFSEKQDQSPGIEVYILFEHKSYEDDKIFIQLLKYMYSMWQEDSDADKPLRMIIPLVFYHGKKEWVIPREFKDQFNVKEELQEFLLNFKYILFDTEPWDFEDESNAVIKDNVFLLTSLMLMKAVFQKNNDIIEKIFDFWHKKNFFTNKDNKSNMLIFFLSYITYTKDIDPEKLAEMLEKSLNDGGNTMPTLAERWIEQGIEQGRIIEDREMLITLLKIKFGINDDEIKLINTIDEVNKLKKALETLVVSDNKANILETLH
ncbi:MAG: Rpn family recombination-promoting nuclease/putative transposase [bacterium]|nr:Rpn family recombination-promoting nuclease/putative transposase [bacterium]